MRAFGGEREAPRKRNLDDRVGDTGGGDITRPLVEPSPGNGDAPSVTVVREAPEAQTERAARRASS
jgi:hypothetical protein